MTDHICYKCEKSKPSTDFSKDKSKPSGMKSICKTCISKATLKACQFCAGKFMGGSKAKNCPQCVKTKSSAELYQGKKPPGKCPGKPESDGSAGGGCGILLKDNRSKYCKECKITKEDYNRLYMKKRREDPEFVEKEQKYLNEYCERKGITRGELWADIFVNRAIRE